MKLKTIQQFSSQTLKHLYPISADDWFSQTATSDLNFRTVKKLVDAHFTYTENDCSTNVLDWGCGNLLWALGLFPGSSVTGIELSKENLYYARINAEIANPKSNFTGIEYDENISLSENSFDYSISFGLVEFLDYKIFNNIFSEIFKALKPGGKLIVTLHNWRLFSAVYLPWILRGGYSAYVERTKVNISKKNLRDVSTDFLKLGFNVLDSGGYNPYPAKLWPLVFSDVFYITHNNRISSWYYTQFLILQKPKKL